MYIRQGLMALGITVSLTACGVFSDTFGRGDDSSSLNDPEQVTDDWSCESNDSGEWDCYQEQADKDDVNGPQTDAAQEELNIDSQYKDTSAISSDVVPQVDGAAAENPAIADLGGEDQAAYLKRNYDWQELSSAAYVLQLASHTSHEKAEMALSALDAPGAEIVKTWSDDGDRFVIIAGRYANRSTAEEAATEYLARNTGATYWIRSTANLLKAL